MSEKLAQLLFPQIDKTPDYYEKIYPERNLPKDAKVTRLGPSPTGFMHLGNLYGAFVDERLAHQSDGIFYLRIEDTDDKRYVEGAVETIIKSLDYFGIHFDEGATMSADKGNYGNYTQSKRGEIYQTYAKELVKRGLAYPCFLTEDEITAIRDNQEKQKLTPGIYGDFAPSRGLTLDEVNEKIRQGLPWVLRLHSTGDWSQRTDIVRKVKIKDAIRGFLEIPENFHDVVILKATGIPTYHFAHVIDDHLMRTTHVVRGAEWLPSLPIHIELFEKLGFEPPVYCHTAQLMKLDEEGNKRKLSKRKDPELSLDYYRSKGYHPAAIREYLLTILNSNFEEWRMANPELNYNKFPFTTEKMSNSGALFDLDKLNNISKDVLLSIPAEELYDFYKNWAKEFSPEIINIFEDKDYLCKLINLGRDDKKPRKDLIYGEQIIRFISCYFDSLFDDMEKDALPEETNGHERTILTNYLETYSHGDDQSQWFEKIREIGTDLGYAAKPKDYKKNPENYKGHVGHVSTVIRIALLGRATSPDVWTIQQIMGEEHARKRITSFIKDLK
ncbi:glutamate--tRNA ligase [Eubacteriales bacterium KG125]